MRCLFSTIVAITTSTSLVCWAITRARSTACILPVTVTFSFFHHLSGSTFVIHTLDEVVGKDFNSESKYQSPNRRVSSDFQAFNLLHNHLLFSLESRSSSDILKHVFPDRYDIPRPWIDYPSDIDGDQVFDSHKLLPPPVPVLLVIC